MQDPAVARLYALLRARGHALALALCAAAPPEDADKLAAALGHKAAVWAVPSEAHGTASGGSRLPSTARSQMGPSWLRGHSYGRHHGLLRSHRETVALAPGPSKLTDFAALDHPGGGAGAGAEQRGRRKIGDRGGGGGGRGGNGGGQRRRRRRWRWQQRRQRRQQRRQRWAAAGARLCSRAGARPALLWLVLPLHHSGVSPALIHPCCNCGWTSFGWLCPSLTVVHPSSSHSPLLQVRLDLEAAASKELVFRRNSAATKCATALAARSRSGHLGGAISWPPRAIRVVGRRHQVLSRRHHPTALGRSPQSREGAQQLRCPKRAAARRVPRHTLTGLRSRARFGHAGAGAAVRRRRLPACNAVRTRLRGLRHGGAPALALCPSTGRSDHIRSDQITPTFAALGPNLRCSHLLPPRARLLWVVCPIITAVFPPPPLLLAGGPISRPRDRPGEVARDERRR